MPRVTSSTDIDAPPEVIWSLLSDPYRYPEIADPADRMVEVPDEEFGAGYTYKEYGGVPPFKAESEWTVTVFEPVHRQVHVGDDGTMRLHLDNLLEPTESGTRFIQILELKPRWYMAPLSAVLWTTVDAAPRPEGDGQDGGEHEANRRGRRLRARL